jgi:DNA-binding response OmpR family regulator
VEDDSSLRELYRTALRTAGFTVVAVGDGVSALRSVETRRPSAVVLDLSLPYVGGRDVQRELKAGRSTRNIPIIVVSGTDMSDLDERDFAMLLAKPVKPDDLVMNVEQAIQRSRAGER